METCVTSPVWSGTAPKPCSFDSKSGGSSDKDCSARLVRALNQTWASMAHLGPISVDLGWQHLWQPNLLGIKTSSCGIIPISNR